MKRKKLSSSTSQWILDSRTPTCQTWCFPRQNGLCAVSAAAASTVARKDEVEGLPENGGAEAWMKHFVRTSKPVVTTYLVSLSVQIRQWIQARESL